MNLLKKKCVPCEGGMRPLTKKQAKDYLKCLDGWHIKKRKIRKQLVFRDFVTLMKFVNKMARLAEREGHHPDFCIHYRKLDIEIWTHDVGGLSEKDFALAAKIDRLYEKFKKVNAFRKL